MIKKWIKESYKKENKFFKIIDIDEIQEADEQISSFLAELVLFSYRNKKFLIEQFKGKKKEEIIKYLEDYVFPGDCDTLTKNVKQGDFGEIISKELISSMRELNVPFCKLMWKFNKDKSVFCTDILAHNNGQVIKDIIYYEVKTRIINCPDVCIEAHTSLMKDMPTESIADYLQRFFFEKAETLNNANNKEEAEKYYSLSKQYMDIVTNSQRYNKSYEIILVIEKSKFNENYLKKLEDLPPQLKPLSVTVIKISNLKELYVKTYELAKDKAVKLSNG